MKLALAALVVLSTLFAATPAQATPLHPCGVRGDTALDTRGVQCHYGWKTANLAIRAAGTPTGTRHVRVRGVVGWTFEETHTFDCAVRRSATRLAVDCHDFGGALRGVALIRWTTF